MTEKDFLQINILSNLTLHARTHTHTTVKWHVVTVTLCSQTGTTALFFAAQGGYMDIASLLLEHGAIVDSCSVVSERQTTRGERSRVYRACNKISRWSFTLTYSTWISGRRHAALRRMPIRSSGRRGRLNRERRQSERSHESKKAISFYRYRTYLAAAWVIILLLINWDSLINWWYYVAIELVRFIIL